MRWVMSSRRSERDRATELSWGQGRYLLPLAIACLWATGCQTPEEPPITLQVGPNQVLSFSPRSAFAYYYELPGHDDVLRLVLASYPMSCESFIPPGPGDVYVTVTVFAPPTTTIEPGEYRWEGRPSEEDQEESEPRAYALPFVRLAKEGRPLPPGGLLKLKTLQKEALGLVEGQFAFRDGGDNQAATAALMGDFSLRLCHTDFDPARAAQGGE